MLKIIDQAQFITTRAAWSMVVIGVVATGIGLGLSLLLSSLFVKQRIEHELAAAAKIQSHLIPQKIPQLPSYKIVARNVPSEVVSGDFYDFIPLSGSSSDFIAERWNYSGGHAKYHLQRGKNTVNER